MIIVKEAGGFCEAIQPGGDVLQDGTVIAANDQVYRAVLQDHPQRQVTTGALTDLDQALIIQSRPPRGVAGQGADPFGPRQSELASIFFRKELSLNPFCADRDLIPNLGTDL